MKQLKSSEDVLKGKLDISLKIRIVKTNKTSDQGKLYHEIFQICRPARYPNPILHLDRRCHRGQDDEP
jgi:hypothetical protein